SHWAIDSACHPYIFYATDSLTQNVGNAHQLFEEQIDRGILEVNGLSVKDYQSRKLCRYPRELPVLVHEMMQPAFEKLSSLEISLQDVSESMKDFYDYQVLFHDPSGAKQRFVKFAEKFTDTGGLGESMFLPQKYDDKLDALNLRHEAWVHPCDRTMVSHESFCDLADGAVRNHLQILEALDQYLYESGSENAVLDIVGNKSFETGMEPGIKRQYYRLDGITA
ncbi:MAG: hypothetical protein IJI05_02545, partial [Erysipelotrichaceae bacterium]|nr:hypothetical protein [Erysipelotrichaceae bacterium]